jgi:Arc/MetJ-type ribon-helix-helix transcriptional regulator
MPRNLRGLAGRISGGDTNQNRWAGFRDLEEKQLQTLAEEIVEQVRLRGPFASMSEFVNRRLTSEGDKASGAGTLEMAIRETDINSNSRAANPRMVTAADTADFGYANVTAALGDTEEGANSFLTQGDLLEALGASLTVRSDTFVVRAYGDTKDAKGNIIAKAVCEAVVQRVAPFVDSTDAPEKVQAALGDQARAIGSLTELNRRFGRRFEVVSMRWLSPEEV